MWGWTRLVVVGKAFSFHQVLLRVDAQPRVAGNVPGLHVTVGVTAADESVQTVHGDRQRDRETDDQATTETFRQAHGQIKQTNRHAGCQHQNGDMQTDRRVGRRASKPCEKYAGRPSNRTRRQTYRQTDGDTMGREKKKKYRSKHENNQKAAVNSCGRDVSASDGGSTPIKHTITNCSAIYATIRRPATPTLTPTPSPTPTPNLNPPTTPAKCFP